MQEFFGSHVHGRGSRLVDHHDSAILIFHGHTGWNGIEDGLQQHLTSLKFLLGLPALADVRGNRTHADDFALPIQYCKFGLQHRGQHPIALRQFMLPLDNTALLQNLQFVGHHLFGKLGGNQIMGGFADDFFRRQPTPTGECTVYHRVAPIQILQVNRSR